MDRERLTRLLEEPSRVAREDLSDLRSLTERFPWFSGAQLLLAMGEHATGDVLFDEQLKVTAAHLPSRAMLFDGVRNESVQRAPVKLTIVREEHVPVGTPLADRSRPLPPDREALEALPISSWVKEISGAEEVDEVEGPVISEEPPIAVPLIREEVAPAAEPRNEMDDPLDREMRRSAVAASYDLERSVPAPVPELPVAQVDMPQVILEEEPTAVEPSRFAAVMPTPLLLQEEAPKPVLTMSSRLRFTDWLSQAEEPPAPTAAFDALPAGPEVADWLRSVPESMAGSTAEQAPPSLPHVHSTKEIVDGFIQRSAPVAARKAEFFTPQQAAKRSLQDDGLVSETLARVYEKQGNFAKAMEAYQRLALKHPEKSVYFAALSKALEGRSNK